MGKIIDWFLDLILGKVIDPGPFNDGDIRWEDFGDR